MREILRRSIASALFILVMEIPFQTEAVASGVFTVSGHIATKFFRINGAIDSVSEYNFSVCVSNCVWDIELLPVSKGSDSFEAKYDGENIYYIHNLTSQIATLKAAGKNVASNVATGMVGKNKVPHDPFAEAIGVLWLTYASACYFANLTNDQVEVMFCRSDSIMEWDQIAFQTGRWDLNSKSSLPENLSLFNDGHRLTFRSVGPTFDSKYHAPYDKGFKIAQFEVLSNKEFSGGILPSSASFKIYGIKPEGKSSSDLRLVSEHVVTCTNIVAQGAIDNLPPILPGETAVMDSRFFAEKTYTFNYRCQNQMLTDSAVRKLPEYKLAKKIGWVTPKNSPVIPEATALNPGRRSLVLVLLILATILPLPFLLKMVWKKNKNK